MVSPTAARPEVLRGTDPLFAVTNGIATYKLRQACPIDLRIYDICGRKLFEFNRVQTPGSYSLALKHLMLAEKLYIIHFKAGGMERQLTVQGRETY
jgi:hypothetical protein